MPKVKNYIETKPISAALYEKRNPIGLTNATNICKIYTDVLGNETKIYKEKFKLSVDWMIVVWYYNNRFVMTQFFRPTK